MKRLRSIDDVTNQPVRRIVEQVDPRGGTAPFPVDEKRAAFRMAASRSGAPEPVGLVEDDATAEGVPVRTYVPERVNDASPALLYLHGGGFLSGDLETHDPVCRMLANATGSRVTAVAYRLAPEHPFPAAVEDSFSALRWLMGSYRSRIAVAGDSAGGNLAAVMALRARDAGIPLAAQVLIYPMLDATLSLSSVVENGLVPPFMLIDCVYAWQVYLGPAEIDRRSPEVSPLCASNLAGLPPALVITAELDILRDEGVRYAERLREAGNVVRHEHFEDMVHGFFQWAAHVGEARTGLGKIVDFLRSV